MAPSAAEARIQEWLRSFPGSMGVAATHLRTGEWIAVNGDTRFPTASTIKTAIMVEVFRQADEGRLSLDALVRLEDTDKVGGMGVLSGLRAGGEHSLADLLYLMMAISDNTATNLLLRQVGTAAVNARMAALGLPRTRLYRPTFRQGEADAFPDEEREFGLGSSTPREMALLMEAIANGEAASSAACVGMLALLRKQQVRTLIPRLLPEEPGAAVVGHKTGQDDEKVADDAGVLGVVRADAGIVDTRAGRYVIAIFARRVRDRRPSPDNEAVLMGAAVSRLVFDHFGAR